jgi:hypothetical protein
MKFVTFRPPSDLRPVTLRAAVGDLLPGPAGRASAENDPLSTDGRQLQVRRADPTEKLATVVAASSGTPALNVSRAGDPL